MTLSSPKFTLDDRLLSVEELFRQRQYAAGVHELEKLAEQDFAAKEYDLGLYLSLRADGRYFESLYRHALDDGLRAVKLLADYPLNKRYGRAQLVLAKAYSAVGDLKNASMRARDGLAAFRRANEPLGQVDSLNELARIAYYQSDFKAALQHLEEAESLVQENPRKTAQLTGNIARLHIHLGQWEEALDELNRTLSYNEANDEEIPQALNHLSIGYLNTRMRRFIMAGKHLDRALEIISRLGLKREKVIYLEYAGDLALERGDMFRAKSILTSGYEKGLTMAPGSALISQTVRRLAEVELALDNIDEAMRCAQKALEASTKVGERLEVGLSRKVIAEVFAARGEFADALEHIRAALSIVGETGDQYELARTLLVYAEVMQKAPGDNRETIKSAFEQALELFRGLAVEYWVAETAFLAGEYYCRRGSLSEGFRLLNKAERLFGDLSDKVKLRAVGKFLRTLSDQAVAVSISQENEFKIFGNLVTDAELSSIRGDNIHDVLSVLLKRTGGERALVYATDYVESPVDATFDLTGQQVGRFVEKFNALLGEEISRARPTLLLDCRRDPYINDLFPEKREVVASVIVVPFKTGDAHQPAYLYIDRLSRDNNLNPFSQMELNFAVGFSDILGFKWAQFQKVHLVEDNRRLKEELREQSAFPNIITQNADLMDMLTQVRQVIDSNISITIEGETGSGKDVLVRAIHYSSVRRDKRFVSVNCAALPETLLESELFGFRRGAFTGAEHDKPGLFEEADGGTFFLDEIGDMPLGIQAKVLRVLEQKEIVRLGETKPRQVDVRIISATNRELSELMHQKLFREDLFYRLSALSFRLPPLRERKDDIPLLVEHFLRTSALTDGRKKSIAADVLQKMVAYDWPGNVRELENEVKKMALLAGRAEVIGPEVLSRKISALKEIDGARAADDVDASDQIVFDRSYSLYDYLEHHERRFIIKALKERKGVKKHAADLLGIPESTLRLKIKQYDIDPKEL